MSRTLVAVSLLICGWLASGARGSDCTTDGLNDTMQVTIGDLDWTIYYDSASVSCNAAVDSVGDDVVFDVIDVLQFSYQRQQLDWEFEQPWFTVLPDAPLKIALDVQDTGIYDGGGACTGLDSLAVRCSDDKVMRTLPHETFHAIQYRYGSLAPQATGFQIFDWCFEGTARCLDDRYTLEDDPANGFHGDASGWLINENPLFDSGYNACLPFSYLCERLGTVKVEPERGVDFIRLYWEKVSEVALDNGAHDFVEALERAIASSGGGSLNKMWVDFAIACYTREFDVSGLDDPNRYRFVDEVLGPPIQAPYSNLARTEVFPPATPLPQTRNGEVPEYAIHAYEYFPQAFSSCTAFGFSGESDEDLGWALVAVRPGAPEQVETISAARGREFTGTVLGNVFNEYSRVTLIVTGLDTGSDYEIKLGAGVFSATIERPTSSQPEHAGPAADPNPILVRMLVLGPAELTPAGIGQRSVKGLVKDDFVVTIGGDVATVVAAQYVGGEYWLVVQPEPAPADGLYDLTVSLCGDAPGNDVTRADSVEFGDLTINHMIVLDRSGSMAEPGDGESKLAAAKNAASLYVDAVGADERVGFVWFHGDETSCTDDATTAVALGTANGAKRTAIKNALAPLGATGWTSIGDGMWDAQDEFDPLAALAGNRDVMVLLSDGEENETRFWDLDINCGGSDEGDAVRDRMVATDTQVTAIAFGPEANQELMQDIADTTDGDFTYVDVTIGGGGFAPGDPLSNELADGYMLALQRARRIERLDFAKASAAAAATTDVVLDVADATVANAAFFINWPASAGTPGIVLRNPQGAVVSGTAASIRTAPTHVVYLMNGDIAGGDWTFEVTVAGAANVPVFAGVLGRPTNGVRMLSQAAQISNGGPFANQFMGQFEPGVPVQLLSLLYDEDGPVVGAAVQAVITLPDNTSACGPMTLHDDGAHGDGAADDGVYGAVFRDTQMSGLQNGTINDDPNDPNPGGESGSYVVNLEASLDSPAAGAFRRFDRASFHVARTNTTLDDVDGDMLPDTWEVHYGTNPLANDANLDPDGDGLNNLGEFERGGHPFDPDTDNGGETDGSEASFGRCLNDPADDALPKPAGPIVLGTANCLDYSALVLPNANRLHFPMHPAWQSLRVYRNSPATPNVLNLLTTLSGPALAQQFYYDGGLQALFEYRYQLEAVSATGAVSARSRVFRGTPHPAPAPFYGAVSINHDSAQTDRTSVLAVLDPPETANGYRLSNAPLLGTEAVNPIPASRLVNANLAGNVEGRAYGLWVQYVDTTQNLTSGVYSDTIVMSRFGNFDADGLPNNLDLDDDNDGLSDTIETFTEFTDAYQRDTDGDTLLDGAEVADGCVDPLNPDTDNDGLPDNIDGSPASDVNGDLKTDMLDLAVFQLCVSGAAHPACPCLDANGDSVIDADDFPAFEAGWTGP